MSFDSSTKTPPPQQRTLPHAGTQGLRRYVGRLTYDELLQRCKQSGLLRRETLEELLVDFLKSPTPSPATEDGGSSGGSKKDSPQESEREEDRSEATASSSTSSLKWLTEQELQRLVQGE